MILLPAIDLKEGRCVRLYQGDFQTAQEVAASPLEAARAFLRAGAKWLHLVDLDGAKSRRPVNRKTILEIAKSTGLQVEVGGGIRDMQTVEDYLQCGIARVILGSAALSDPELVRQAAARYGGRIAVGIDARGGRVAADGWLHTSETGFIELAGAMEQAGIQTIIYTDIGRDGTLQGPNLAELAALKSSVGCRIIASGGVRDLADIKALAALGMDGAICGKSLYEGTLPLSEALAFLEEEEKNAS
ncbi:MAG: 1-(5-phosphoribosyl)-5-[(5-phosphoribosylamino)methylideneamino]imidazole-4-carboxamide isomerase [Provencibacterium sp.]|jgi:phosphoribosylformimino-5-aminoimidazole carboxamide ribotide isomerase|nr:1-(5-phosphoribosyl)-5-[(5-phosphoribosylamino)methylideneamino]imidazole-4-carboxamide isomerase [Provencibacterium sp.]